jgi:protein-L-isoaspartate(D-aspartate) O-methyltransferase
VPSGELEAQDRNEQLVAQLESGGALHDPAVASAFRAVLRHRFLPGRPLDEVYEDSAIMTKIGEHGAAVSSSSQPAIMAIMLELLRLQPGHRVLEIGAGTGYNAALIAHVVGPDGRVVTLDIDADLAQQARDNLAAAGVTGVDVVQGDGAAGWPPGAPYHRAVVTAGADDLSPAWRDQLVEAGRLVLPLSLTGPAQQCIAFVRRGPTMASDYICPCGFMHLRGDMAPAPPAADEELAGWLAEGGRATGHSVPAAHLRAGFEMWLGLTEGGYVRPGAFGLRDGRGAALVVGDGDERPITVFGNGDDAAARLVEAHRVWARERPSLDRLRIAAHPHGEEPATMAGARTVRRSHFTFVVST